MKSVENVMIIETEMTKDIPCSPQLKCKNVSVKFSFFH